MSIPLPNSGLVQDVAPDRMEAAIKPRMNSAISERRTSTLDPIGVTSVNLGDNTAVRFQITMSKNHVLDCRSVKLQGVSYVSAACAATFDFDCWSLWHRYEVLVGGQPADDPSHNAHIHKMKTLLGKSKAWYMSMASSMANPHYVNGFDIEYNASFGPIERYRQYSGGSDMAVSSLYGKSALNNNTDRLAVSVLGVNTAANIGLASVRKWCVQLKDVIPFFNMDAYLPVGYFESPGLEIVLHPNTAARATVNLKGGAGSFDNADTAYTHATAYAAQTVTTAQMKLHYDQLTLEAGAARTLATAASQGDAPLIYHYIAVNDQVRALQSATTNNLTLTYQVSHAKSFICGVADSAGSLAKISNFRIEDTGNLNTFKEYQWTFNGTVYPQRPVNNSENAYLEALKALDRDLDDMHGCPINVQQYKQAFHIIGLNLELARGEGFVSNNDMNSVNQQIQLRLDTEAALAANKSLYCACLSDRFLVISNGTAQVVR